MNIKKIIDSHLQWAADVFPKATSIGALIHLEREIKEVVVDIHSGAPREKLVEEYADCFGCLYSSMARENITLEELMASFEKKLKKNKIRIWEYNGDGSYSHIKCTTHGIAIGDRVTRKERKSRYYQDKRHGTVISFDKHDCCYIKWDEKVATGQQHSTVNSKVLIKL